MKKLPLALVVLLGIFWLTGCIQPPHSPTAVSVTATTPHVASATSAMSASPVPFPTATPDPRFALIQEVVNHVIARPHPQDQPIPAKPGLKIYTGGDVQTGDESRAALLLLPEETVVRIGANTHFVLQARDPAAEQTLLQMILGKIWVILKGGHLDIETPSGTASVRGSLMSVDYDATGALKVACMEGHCRLRSTSGAVVELTGGQAAVISAPGAAPSEPFPVPPEEWQEWQEIAPDAISALPPTPTLLPTAYRLTNNCDEVWHWRFSGPQSIVLDIPPHTTATGTLPDGTYTAVDWVGDNTAETHNTGPITPGGYISATVCR